MIVQLSLFASFGFSFTTEYNSLVFIEYLEPVSGHSTEREVAFFSSTTSYTGSLASEFSMISKKGYSYFIIKHCYSHYGSVCLVGNVVRMADFVSD